MQTTHDSPNQPDARRSYDETVVADEIHRDDAVPQAARLIALAAGAIVAIVGLFAVLSVEWGTAEVDSPTYDVLGMTFTPVLAVVTAVLGVLLILTAASRSSEGKIAMGAIVASLGAAILLVNDLENRWQVQDTQGWLALVIGIVFIVAGILTERGRVVRRQARAVHHDAV